MRLSCMSSVLPCSTKSKTLRMSSLSAVVSTRMTHLRYSSSGFIADSGGTPSVLQTTVMDSEIAARSSNSISGSMHLK